MPNDTGCRKALLGRFCGTMGRISDSVSRSRPHVPQKQPTALGKRRINYVMTRANFLGLR
jgi:hypothetical protein